MGEKQSQDPKVCVECKVEKHGRSFDPGCKKCNSCRYKQQKENQSEDPKVCAECKVKKHGLSFKPGCNKCNSCRYKQQKENQNEDPKVCVECKVKKHGLKFGPGCKKCSSSTKNNREKIKAKMKNSTARMENVKELKVPTKVNGIIQISTIISKTFKDIR